MRAFSEKDSEKVSIEAFSRSLALKARIQLSKLGQRPRNWDAQNTER